MHEAGIVIVTYQSGAEIGACLDCALASGAPIVVVDNASTDDTCKLADRPHVHLITNRENRGFAAAVNQGIQALDTPFVLLLNPDALIQTSIDALVECCRQDGVAAAGGKLVDGAGRPQVGFNVRSLPTPGALICEILLINRLWPSNPANWHYRCLGFNLSAPGDVEQPAGAFLMIRRDVWRELNGFDERFHPLWFEDVDFCWRVREKGYRIRYTPDAVAKHTGGHSIAKISLEKRQLYWYRSLLGFANKHYRSSTVRMICTAVLLGAIPRMIVEVAASRSFASIGVYGKVMGLAGRMFIRPTV